jgi:hypothetical protein
MKLLNILSFSLVALVFLDTVLTIYGITHKPNIKELNPLYNMLPLTINAFIKMALTIFLVFLMYGVVEISAPNLDIATFINLLALILNVVYLCIVINNIIMILAA